MKVISNTGPIIGLAKIDKLSLLKELAEEILIPPLVYRELLGKCGWESSRIDLAINSFIKVTELSEISNEIKQVISTLDGGEKQEKTFFLYPLKHSYKDENTSVDNLGQIQNNLI